MYNVGLAQEAPMPGSTTPQDIADTIPSPEADPMADPMAEPVIEPPIDGAAPETPVPESGNMVYIDKMGDKIVIIKYLEPGQQPTSSSGDPKFPRGPFPDDPESIQKEMEAVEREVGAGPTDIGPIGGPEGISPEPELETPLSNMPTMDQGAGPENLDAINHGGVTGSVPPEKEVPPMPPPEVAEDGTCTECAGTCTEEYVSDIDIALGLKKGQLKTVVESKRIDPLSSGGILKSTSQKTTAGAHEVEPTEYEQMKPENQSTIFKSPSNKKS
jgi:hypothetical protein